jgi:hypothetical protein
VAGRGSAIFAAIVLAAASWSAASAQSLPPPSTGLRGYAPATQGPLPQGSIGMVPPSSGGIAPPTFRAPGGVPTPPTMAAPQLGGGAAGAVSLSLAARYGHDAAAPIANGLLWRVFPAKPDATGTFRVLKEDRSASPVMTLAPGEYVIHVSFGFASAAKAIRLKEATREVLEIPAGGIKLEGRVGDVKIPAGQISFDIYKGSQFDPGLKTPLVQAVGTGDVVVVVPEGTYHIVSNYGDTNAVVRSDIRVQAGKLTDVVVNHRAALITLKLVTERGGEALANTSWSIITPGGDVIKEYTGAFPRVILAEGDYRAIARNDSRTYERDFKVITGVDGEVEVLAR